MIPNVPLVTIMHPFLIRSLNIQLPRLFGGIVATCFGANNVYKILIKSGRGLNSGFLMELTFTHLACYHLLGHLKDKKQNLF